MLRNHRRSSLGGSSISLSSRKSSLNPKDIERIQAVIQKQRQISTQLLFCILVVSPIFTFIYNCAIVEYDGAILQMLSDFWRGELPISTVFPPPTDIIAWRVVAFIVLLQLVFALILPHDNVIVLNTSGDREWRRINGFWSCILLVLLYVMGAGLGFYKGSVVFVHWTNILSVLNLLAIILVLMLYLKCQLSDPTTSEIVSDLFFGRELAPVLFDIDIKHFTTYRIAFTMCPLYIVSALYFNHSLYGKITDGLLACSVLQLTYIARTQWLEHLHFSRLDAQLDKAGFYRIWGVVVFWPILYLTPVTVMSNDGTSVPLPVCVILLAVGLMAMYTTADIDLQRFTFRHANGNLKVWRKDPFFITAKFKQESGEISNNLLLGSGWWGLSRHLNYAFEWLTFASWSVLPGTWAFLHYIPLIFLGAFLWSRMLRDENRCLAKYGHGWIQYTNRVPYLIIPSLY